MLAIPLMLMTWQSTREANVKNEDGNETTKQENNIHLLVYHITFFVFLKKKT